MQLIPRKSDMTSFEFSTLCEIVARSFLSSRTVPAASRMRLVELGLVRHAMGGLMPTPAGKIVARM
jgi:hypothetical protein